MILAIEVALPTKPLGGLSVACGAWSFGLIRVNPRPHARQDAPLERDGSGQDAGFLEVRVNPTLSRLERELAPQSTMAIYGQSLFEAART